MWNVVFLYAYSLLVAMNVSLIALVHEDQREGIGLFQTFADRK
jgi:hypothetical protein